MSLDATKWAWEQTGLSPTQKLILPSMADRADEDNRCYPTNARLQADTGLNRKTIQKCINLLIERGLISDSGQRSGRTKQVIVYMLIGVANRDTKEAQKRNSTKSGTVPKYPERGPKTDIKRPKIGLRNLSITYQGIYQKKKRCF